MSEKPSKEEPAKVLEAELREKTLTDADRKKLEGEITEGEVRKVWNHALPECIAGDSDAELRITGGALRGTLVSELL